jgi:hypothetical protein
MRRRRVLLRWQASQPYQSRPTVARASTHTLVLAPVPTRGTGVPSRPPKEGPPLVMPPRGEWSGQAERMRFARLIQRRVRAFGQAFSLRRLRRHLKPGLVDR